MFQCVMSVTGGVCDHVCQCVDGLIVCVQVCVWRSVFSTVWSPASTAASTSTCAPNTCWTVNKHTRVSVYMTDVLHWPLLTTSEKSPVKVTSVPLKPQQCFYFRQIKIFNWKWMFSFDQSGFGKSESLTEIWINDIWIDLHLDELRSFSLWCFL